MSFSSIVIYLHEREIMWKGCRAGWAQLKAMLASIILALAALLAKGLCGRDQGQTGREKNLGRPSFEGVRHRRCAHDIIVLKCPFLLPRFTQLPLIERPLTSPPPRARSRLLGGLGPGIPFRRLNQL